MNNCWVHPVTSKTGYGLAWHGGKTVLVHRRVYEELVGPVPVGMCLDHLCRNRACYNPDHLDVVTGAVNIRRGHQARGTTARHGTTHMYNRYQCRCSLCKYAKRRSR